MHDVNTIVCQLARRMKFVILFFIFLTLICILYLQNEKRNFSQYLTQKQKHNFELTYDQFKSANNEAVEIANNEFHQGYLKRNGKIHEYLLGKSVILLRIIPQLKIVNIASFEHNHDTDVLKIQYRNGMYITLKLIHDEWFDNRDHFLD